MINLYLTSCSHFMRVRSPCFGFFFVSFFDRIQRKFFGMLSCSHISMITARSSVALLSPFTTSEEIFRGRSLGEGAWVKQHGGRSLGKEPGRGGSTTSLCFETFMGMLKVTQYVVGSYNFVASLILFISISHYSSISSTSILLYSQYLY